MNKKFEIEQIGTIYTSYKTKDECPIQGYLKPKGIGKIELFPEYMGGLKTIESFSHIILFYVFDKAGEIKLSRSTFLDDAPHGIFSSRHPCRPNSIGISIVKLEKRNENILVVSGIDILDGTPLIDIKPYVPRFDCFSNANNGWIENKEDRQKPKDRE